MRKGYEKHILVYNDIKFCLMIRADLDIFFLSKILTKANQNAEL